MTCMTRDVHVPTVVTRGHHAVSAVPQACTGHSPQQLELTVDRLITCMTRALSGTFDPQNA